MIVPALIASLLAGCSSDDTKHAAAVAALTRT
jgi:hypothetical protein